MWFTTPERPFNNIRTKIKNKKHAFSRGKSADSSPNGRRSICDGTKANWEFMNFNPATFRQGRRCSSVQDLENHRGQEAGDQNFQRCNSAHGETVFEEAEKAEEEVPPVAPRESTPVIAEEKPPVLDPHRRMSLRSPEALRRDFLERCPKHFIRNDESASSSAPNSPKYKSENNVPVCRPQKNRRPSFFYRSTHISKRRSSLPEQEEEFETELYEPQNDSGPATSKKINILKNGKKMKRIKEDGKNAAGSKNGRLLNLKRNSLPDEVAESYRINRMFGAGSVGRLEAVTENFNPISPVSPIRNGSFSHTPPNRGAPVWLLAMSFAELSGDRPVTGVRGIEKRPDTVRESEERPQNDDDNAATEDRLHGDITHHATKTKNSTTNINRSESYRERIPQKKIREKRKTSDPNLSKTNDVDLEPSLSYTNSGSSSNSSLSTRSLDSPSVDMVTATPQPRTQDSVTVSLTPSTIQSLLGDSDTEAETDPPDWTKGVDEAILKSLTAREKKRQEVVNELFHTEKSHVRKLKVLDQVFLKPMQELQILPADQLQLLFQNLEEMLDIHSRFNNAMKARKKEDPLVGDIGDILLNMFDGPDGEYFQKAAAKFCEKQQIALEALKEKRRKDTKLSNFLTEAEGNPMCRRLQLKDMLPTVMQRLTKYPLLFENLAKYSPSGSEEEKSVQKAVERSKEILNQVNQAVRAAEDHQRLADIQRRLDKSAFDKIDHPMTNEFKNLDLRKHKLIYEGSLNWRIGGRGKLIEIHVLLLDDIIILLQKQDDKYVLKFYNMNTPSGGAPPLSPIVKVSAVLARHNAVDKSALFLVNTSQNSAQIYDLVASSPTERKIWLRHISEAADAYKHRDFGKNRRADLTASSLPQSPPDTEAADDSIDKTKDADESNDGAKEGNDLDISGTSQEGGESNQSNDSSQTQSTTPTPHASPSSAGLSDATDHGRKSVDSSPSQRRKAEPLRLMTVENSLIQPSEVVVFQKSVLTAEPVLTPLEQLRLKDEAIRRALEEKQQLVADILHVPREEFDTIAELAGEPSVDKEATELVLAAVSQANQLAAALNDALRITEEAAVTVTSEVLPGYSPRGGRRKQRLPGVPAQKLQGISNNLNSQLTQLLKIIKERDEERERLRKELQRSREQIHVLHETHRKSSSSPLHSTVTDGVAQESGDALPDQSDVTKDTDTDETVTNNEQQNTEAQEVKPDSSQEVFVDAVSGDSETSQTRSETTEPKLETEESLPVGVE